MATKYPTMNWKAENVPEAFKIYKQKLSLVCEDNEVTDPASIARKIKIGLDNEGLRRLRWLIPIEFMNGRRHIVSFIFAIIKCVRR